MPDPGTTDQTSSAIPAPGAGTGPADFMTDSNDPQELRALLERARERLSFYESFDKIIAENLRRTGEMMAETVALREQAAEEIRNRQAADKAMAAERQRYRSLLEDALSEVRTAQPVIDAMVARLQDALDELGSTEPSAAKPSTATDQITRVTPPLPEPKPERLTPDAPDTATPTPSTAEEPPAETTLPERSVPDVEVPDESPGTIEILAHGVPSAATAIGLQQMLREIDAISRVEAREFADGELRLHVESAGNIPDEVLTDWLAHNSGSLVSRNARVIELSFT